MFNIISYQENANQNQKEKQLPTKMLIIKKTDKNKWWWRSRSHHVLLVEMKNGAIILDSSFPFPQKLNMDLTYDLVISALPIYLKQLKIYAHA